MSGSFYRLELLNSVELLLEVWGFGRYIEPVGGFQSGSMLQLRLLEHVHELLVARVIRSFLCSGGKLDSQVSMDSGLAEWIGYRRAGVANGHSGRDC